MRNSQIVMLEILAPPNVNNSTNMPCCASNLVPETPHLSISLSETIKLYDIMMRVNFLDI